MNFLFFLQWSLQWIHLSWNDKHWQLQTWVYGAYWAIQLFFCNVMSLLIGSASSVTSGTSYESHVFTQGLWYCTKHSEKYTRTARDHLLPWHAVYCRDELLLQMLGITLHFKWTFTMLVVVQPLSRVRLFATRQTVEHPVSLSFTISWSLLKLMSIELVMPSNHLVLCWPLLLCLQSFPTSGSFPMSQLFTSGDQSIGALASVSVLPMNIQDWFPLGLTDWISLQSKGLSGIFSNTTVQKHQFFGTQLSL